jgi:hypothetical protein
MPPIRSVLMLGVLPIAGCLGSLSGAGADGAVAPSVDAYVPLPRDGGSNARFDAFTMADADPLRDSGTPPAVDDAGPPPVGEDSGVDSGTSPPPVDAGRDGGTRPPVGGTWSWGPHTRARVFLSGHSLTDDPLASNLGSIAAGEGQDYAYNEQIIIGSPMRARTRGAGGWAGYHEGKNRDGSTGLYVVDELRSPATLGAGEVYDTLVITERHDILGTIQWEDTARWLRHYHDRLIEGNPSGHTFFYHSWLSMNKDDPSLWLDHETRASEVWECVTDKINLELEAEGRSERLHVMPTGSALVELVRRTLAGSIPGISGSNRARMDVLFRDDVHLTATGMYFASLVAHASVFGTSAAGGWVPPGVDAGTASALQALAWDFVQNYFASSHVHTMDECRTRTVQTCTTFWQVLGTPSNISGCESYFGNASADGNPFRWPDPSLVPFPAP